MSKDKKDSTDNFDPKAAIKEVSDSLIQSDKFSTYFVNACKKSKDMDKALRNIIKDLIEKDTETRGIISGMIRKIEKEDWRYFVKKVSIVGWTVIIFILSSLTNGLISAIIKSFGTP